MIIRVRAPAITARPIPAWIIFGAAWPRTTAAITKAPSISPSAPIPCSSTSYGISPSCLIGMIRRVRAPASSPRPNAVAGMSVAHFPSTAPAITIAAIKSPRVIIPCSRVSYGIIPSKTIVTASPNNADENRPRPNPAFARVAPSTLSRANMNPMMTPPRMPSTPAEVSSLSAGIVDMSQRAPAMMRSPPAILRNVLPLVACFARLLNSVRVPESVPKNPEMLSDTPLML